MAFFDFLSKNNNNTAQHRKEESIRILKQQGVPFIEHLPLRYEESEVTPRSKKEVIVRAACSFASIMCACSIRDGDYTDEDKRWMMYDFLQNRYGALDFLTPKERDVIENRASEQEVVNAGWKYEAFWSLLWALGIVKELSFPSEICDGGFAMEAMNCFKDIDDFAAGTKLRSMAEILQALDTTYRYHWACVNARVHGTDSAGLNESVVMERRAGLEWLCCKGHENDNVIDEYNSWDYPDMNT